MMDKTKCCPECENCSSCGCGQGGSHSDKLLCCKEHKMTKEHLIEKKEFLEEKLKWVEEKLGESK